MEENVNQNNEQIIDEDEDSRIIDQEYDIPVNKKMKIQNIHGNIIIKGTEGDKIRLKAFIKEPNIDKTEVKLEVQTKIDDDGTINVKTNVDKIDEAEDDDFNWKNFFNKISDIIGFAINRHKLQVEYEVYLPEGMEIYSDNKSGRYTMEDFKGKAELRTMNGRMNIRKTAGELNLITYNGRIEAKDITGKFKAESYNGRITVYQSTLSELLANTKNGRIVAQFKPDENIQYKMKTMNGRIVIGIPKDASIKVRTGTNMGKIIDEINDEVIKSNFGHNELEREFGGGTYTVEAMTMHGKIVIKDYDDFNDEEDDEGFDWDFDFHFDDKPFVIRKKKFKGNEKKEKDVSEEVKMILQMVEDGKITSEEGEKLIKAIKG